MPVSGPTIREIAPASARGEARAVALAALVLAGGWAGGIAWRRAVPVRTELASHQRDAFATLAAAEQGMFADLRAAADEIFAAHRAERAWPEPAALAEQAIPPFARDAAWAARGRPTWQRLDAHGPEHAVYWGRMPAGEWALVLSAGRAAVWRRATGAGAAIPQAIPELLALDGWVELVPRKAGT